MSKKEKTEIEYEMLWRNKWLTTNAKTIDDMINGLSSAVDELKSMKADGITLSDDCGAADDYARLITTNEEVAKKYHLEDRSDEYDDSEEEDVFDPEDEDTADAKD